MSNQFNEPWVYSRVDPSPSSSFHEPYSLWIIGAGPRLVTVNRSQCIHADDYKRIVECVNACASYSTEYLSELNRDGLLTGPALREEHRQIKQELERLRNYVSHVIWEADSLEEVRSRLDPVL